MEDPLVKISNKSCQIRHEDVSRAGRAMVIAAAGHRDLGETVARAIERAARRFDFSFARTRSIYHQRAKISVPEWERMRETIQELQESAERRAGVLDELKVGLKQLGRDHRADPGRDRD